MRYIALLSAILPLAYSALVLFPQVGQPIPSRWIVKLNINVPDNIFQLLLSILPNGPIHIYRFGNFMGFAADMGGITLRFLSTRPEVDFIEQDAIVKANFGSVEKRTSITQNPATWGLGRISHVNRAISSYTYDDSAGANTCVYIIDTGIQANHPEFEGRATFLANYAGDGSNTDGNGHGTHCSGIIGSKTYGVAKKAKLFGIKVLDASGFGANSGVLAGINFAVNDQAARTGCTAGSVGSMSLGGSKSTAINSAAANAVASGLFLAVAAGNDAANASDYSPASEPTVFTVGATDSSDYIGYFSNYGSIVDAFAPGVSILSTWINNKTNTLSGTSMANAYVAGLAAYFLSFEGKKAPATLSSRMIALANKNKIAGLPSGTANNLIFNGQL